VPRHAVRKKGVLARGQNTIWAKVLGDAKNSRLVIVMRAPEEAGTVDL